ncbi:MAG: nucleotidyltransferase family protein [Candidatus Limnocylindria bacterium]
MTRQLDAYVVPEAGSIRDAMIAVDQGAARIALAVDPDGRLHGVVTDGDLRRALLRGADLDDPVAPALTRRFLSVGPSEGRAAALELMRARRIDAVPVVDGAGRAVGLHLLHEFLAPVRRPNWAVIMAGGQGVRLRPLTEQVPKPMLPVAGRPIIERLVLDLVGFGIERVFVSLNYLGEVIEAHLGDGRRLGARVEYLREETALGTAGALGLLPEPPTDPLLLLNGDLVTSADLGGLLDAHAAGDAVATIGIRRYLHTVPFGCVERDGDRVTALEEKPTIEREVNSGMYVLDPSAVARVPAGRRTDTPDLISELLAEGQPVGVFEIEDEWIDIGQREQLAAARGVTS